MKTTVRPRSIVLAVLMALSMVLVLGGPSQADPRSVEVARRHRDGGVRRDAPFVGPRFERRHFDGGWHRSFPHRRFYPSYGYAPFYGVPSYGYSSGAVYWYCPPYGAYYPTVTSCPVGWVTVPAY